MPFHFHISNKYPKLKYANKLMLQNDEDYASYRNHVGYNKGDTMKAHRLDSLPFWTEHDAIWIYYALGRYQNQLEEVHNINWNEIPQPFGKGSECDLILTLQDLDKLEWGPAKVVKTRTGKKKQVSRAINLPPTNSLQNQLFWRAFQILWEKDTNKIKWELGISIERPNQWNNFTKCLVKWEDYKEKKMDVLTPIETTNVLDNYKLQYEDKLLPYQPEHVRKLIYALEHNNYKALDGSDTGTGKSFTGVAVALQKKWKLFIVCPKSVIPAWIKVLKHFGISEDNINKEGGDHFIVNYGLLRLGKLIHNRYSTRTKFYRKYGIPKLMYDTVTNPFMRIEKEMDYKGKLRKRYYWNLPSDYLVIYDEVHRCKNIKTANASTLIGAKFSNCKILGMSATIGESPLKLRAIGFIIGLFNQIGDFWNWARQHGCDYTGWNNTLEFTTNRTDAKYYMIKIHNEIYRDAKRGARMVIAELGDAFPETQITSELYNMEEANKIQEVYDQMEKEIEEIEGRMENDYAHILVTLLRGRQKAEVFKVPTLIDLVGDYIDTGKSIAIFVNFNSTIDALAEKLREKGISFGEIRGGQKPEERQRYIDLFQNDDIRVILCNINAGGIGISLHDVNGDFPRVALLCPNYSIQDLIQALGRVHRGGGKSKSIQRIIFCENTVEEKICKILQSKLNNLNLLNDGDFVTGIQINPQKYQDALKLKKDLLKIHGDPDNLDPEKLIEWANEYCVNIDKKQGLKIIL